MIRKYILNKRTRANSKKELHKTKIRNLLHREFKEMNIMMHPELRISIDVHRDRKQKIINQNGSMQ